jgi:GNAT superfamily N-acetyltransferase
MAIAIRPVEEGDIPFIALIRAANWQSPAFWEDRIRRYLRGEHCPQKSLTARAAFVAVDRGTVVGFVAGHRTTRYGCDAELQWINVLTERRRTGIAGALLMTMASWFADQNAIRVCVNVEQQNSAARNLYTKYGAQALNEHWMVWGNIRVMTTPELD